MKIAFWFFLLSIVAASADAENLLRVVRQGSIELNGDIETVFSLFDPIGESKWAEGWEIRRVYPAQGGAERGFIFTTSSVDHKETIWMISDLNHSDRIIRYVLITPEEKVGEIEISLQPVQQKITRVTVRYVYTALTENGNDFINHFTEKAFAEKMDSWKTAINHYLLTGQQFQHH